jgi:hypothetical protein
MVYPDGSSLFYQFGGVKSFHHLNLLFFYYSQQQPYLNAVAVTNLYWIVSFSKYPIALGMLNAFNVVIATLSSMRNALYEMVNYFVRMIFSSKCKM